MRDDPADALHIVEGTDRNVHIGKLAAEWLVKTRAVAYKGFSVGVGHIYITAKTASEVDSLIMGNAEIRPCDFCHAQGAGWAMHVRPFYMEMGDRMARFERDVVMCADCADLVEHNERAALVERALRGAVELAQLQGGLAADVVRTRPWQLIERHLRPEVTRTVANFLAGRRGHPFEL